MPQTPIVPRQGGSRSVLNISAATVIKLTPGTLFTINVNTAGSAAGTAYDATTVGGNTAANLIADIPNVVGSISLKWPCANGILIVPGTGQVLSVAFA